MRLELELERKSKNKSSFKQQLREVLTLRGSEWPYQFLYEEVQRFEKVRMSNFLL